MERRTDCLTEEQKDALRYALTMTSEQIAPLLGISKKAVDKRIDGARARLNGMGRRQAAELLAKDEGRLSAGSGTGDFVPPARIPLAPEPEIPATVPSSEADEGAGRSEGSPSNDARRNRLDVWQRLGVIVLLMALLAMGASAYIFTLPRH